MGLGFGFTLEQTLSHIHVKTCTLLATNNDTPCFDLRIEGYTNVKQALKSKTAEILLGCKTGVRQLLQDICDNPPNKHDYKTINILLDRRSACNAIGFAARVSARRNKQILAYQR